MGEDTIQIDWHKKHEALKKSVSALQIINEFALTVSQYDSIDELAWATVKHVIAQMDFIDCIVYLLDPYEAHLVQIASYGPKNPFGTEIKNPITIRVGTGIVGSVAETAVSERIPDTLKDPRYIVDDDIRRSEITVPIIHQGVVLGVIDSEHPEPDFYTEEHQNLLTTIALLIAPRIASIQKVNTTLQKTSQQLSDRTFELTQILNDLQIAQGELVKAKEAAETASRAKSVFISKMSHELRSPLTSILGYAQLLQKYKDTSPKISKAATIIENGGQHLLNLINDILVFSKLESETFTLEQTVIHFKSFLDGVMQLSTLNAHNKGLAFTLLIEGDMPDKIVVDDNRLRQALLNLLGNAIKFTEQGSVELKVNATKLIGRSICKLRFEISDTGPGIEPSALDRIFLPFEQSGTATQRAKGTGLGLTITQQILTMMQSRVEVSSKIGKGSTFLFDLTVPYVDSTGKTGLLNRKEIVTGYKGTRLKVLIVDDLETIRSYLHQFLDSIGFEVVEAADGLEGIVEAQRTHPDLIMVDSLMPKLDGKETIMRLRLLPAFKNVPIVAMSANMDPEKLAQTKEAGATVFLSKPFSAQAILDTLKELLDIEWVYE